MPNPTFERRSRILSALQGRDLSQVYHRSDIRADLVAEAMEGGPDALITHDTLRQLEALQAQQAKEGPQLGFFWSTDDVIIVPGFLGSELWDVTGPHGLIWVDPKLIFNPDQLSALRLADYEEGVPERDAEPGVTIKPNGAIPLLYGAMKWDLEMRRYDVNIFGFDWRKHLDESAQQLADMIETRSDTSKPLHLIAHSQGSLVARRALQLLGVKLGDDQVREWVKSLVLLGPASFGSFSAALAISGDHSMLKDVSKYGINPPADFPVALRSMSGIYQLLPWNPDLLDWSKNHDLGDPEFWRVNPNEEPRVDPVRLKALFRTWGEALDSKFFNDRTTIILGDQPTVVGVEFRDGKLQPTEWGIGDGTVPETCARLPGVTTFKAKGAEHMMLPATGAVMAAVRAVLKGKTPIIERMPGVARPKAGEVPFLAEPPLVLPGVKPAVGKPGVPAKPPKATSLPQPPMPLYRRLRVYSFDPLLSGNLDALGIDQIVMQVPWDESDGGGGSGIQPGPVGEYLEVVDIDPASDCFYAPVDLNHPHLLAQDGLPPSEGNPQFHQQMVYAVAMATIGVFEKALGRRALWAPWLEHDEKGKVIQTRRNEAGEESKITEADRFVRRLRIHPHALRQQNAYYDPRRKALLFGYFPAEDAPGGRNLPGGTVFACLSYDIIAHETTHALLDGLHRYFLYPSNPDVFAFHEAFADVVALLQHFHHPEVLRHQMARARGDLSQPSLLGEMAQQFGAASGHRGALRQYLGSRDQKTDEWKPLEPDPERIDKEFEEHDRGAILVAALFHAFVNIYKNRSADLIRVATGGSGKLPDGDLHPDLVARLAGEAAKAAKHLLTMCVRALDYLPPVDITFGEYLRALITADYDLIRDDDRGYRVAVIDAFRKWGIYPRDVRSLSEESLRWQPPDGGDLREFRVGLGPMNFDDWNLRGNRKDIFLNMQNNSAKLHEALRDYVEKGKLADGGRALGLDLNPKSAPRSIARDGNGTPKFEVHSLRPCRRIGPDGQQLTDLVVEIVQKRLGFLDEKEQSQYDDPTSTTKIVGETFTFRGGCTLIIDRESAQIRYCVRKSIRSDQRLRRERHFIRKEGGASLKATYLSDPKRSPFAAMHDEKY